MATSEARKAANQRWNKKAYDQILIHIKKGSKDIIKDHAQSVGESMNQFIVRAIMAQIERDTAESSLVDTTISDTE